MKPLQELSDALLHISPEPPDIDSLVGRTRSKGPVMASAVVATVAVAAGIALNSSQTVTIDQSQEGQLHATSVPSTVNPSEPIEAFLCDSSGGPDAPPAGLELDEKHELLGAVAELLGDDFLSAYPSVDGYLIRGTTSEPPPGLLSLEDSYGVRLGYAQASASRMELSMASSAFQEFWRLNPDLDVRTSYEDLQCGVVVVIVGDSTAATILAQEIEDSQKLKHLAVRIDGSYVVVDRGPGQ